MYEIERKFLLNRPAAEVILAARAGGNLVETIQIEQRYLDDAGDWTLRCRRTSNVDSVHCFLTMKRRVSNQKCVELETPVDLLFYEEMASQCGPALTKTRSKIAIGSHVWEVDVFDTPELWGIEIAEIELADEGDTFEKPEWLGSEITGDRNFTNEVLARKIRETQAAA